MKVSTEPGMIIGTASYMTPEQAKGQEVDSRTDVFSFGVVLYEMFTGMLPFEGDSSPEMIGSILKDEPRPLTDAGLPADLERVVTKALRKDRDERYQTMKGMIGDLKAVKRQLPDESQRIPGGPPATETETEILKAETSEGQKRTTYSTGAQRPRRWSLPIAAGLAIVAVVAATALYFSGFFRPRQAFSQIEIKQLASGSNLGGPVFSPDGNFIAYSRADSGGITRKTTLVIRQLGTGQESSIYETQEGTGALVEGYSPDGQYIYFIEYTPESAVSLYRIASIGGAKKKILEGNYDVSVSPDGKLLAFERPDSKFYVSDADGNNQRLVLDPKEIGADWASVKDWSPDGTKLLFVLYEYEDRGNTREKTRTLKLCEFDPFSGGGARERTTELTALQMQWVSRAYWMRDRSGIILVGRGEKDLTSQIWFVPYPAGEPQRVTRDDVNYYFASLSHDGRYIVASSVNTLQSFWSVDPVTHESNEIQAADSSVQPSSLARSDDGRLFFLRSSGDQATLSSLAEDGGEVKDLATLTGQPFGLIMLPDGNQAITSLSTTSAAASHLVKIAIDGSQTADLTGKGDSSDFSPALANKDEIVFLRGQIGSEAKAKLMIMPISGGTARPVKNQEPDVYFGNPSISPDGKLLAYIAYIEDKDKGTSENYLRVWEYANGTLGAKIFERRVNFWQIDWSPDSRSVIVSDFSNARGNLLRIEIADGKTTNLSEFNSDAHNGNVVWSKDNSRILVIRSVNSSALKIITDLGAK